MSDLSMLDCQSVERLATPYVDGELPASDRDAIDVHVRRCPPCHSRMAAERAVRQLIHEQKSALRVECASPVLHRRCAALCDKAPAVAPPRADAVVVPSPLSGHATGRSRLASFPRVRRSPAWVALAASVAFVAAGAVVYEATEKSTTVMAAELTADHIKCFALNDLMATHQLPSAVESSMLSGFGWHMTLPEQPERADLELIGSRPCLYGEGEVAHIMYRHHGEPVSLFMLPKTARPEELVHVLGHSAAVWCKHDRTFVLIARDRREEVARLASFVQAEMR
jgi:anti-sigma factor RsiW